MENYPLQEVEEIIELACKLSGGKLVSSKFVLEQYEKQRKENKEPIVVGCY